MVGLMATVMVLPSEGRIPELDPSGKTVACRSAWPVVLLVT
jgi:hypothetical protein